MFILNELIYLPKDIKEQWEKRGGLKVLQAFLRDGMELIELYAVFNNEAKIYLSTRPILKKLVDGDDNSNNI